MHRNTQGKQRPSEPTRYAATTSDSVLPTPRAGREWDATAEEERDARPAEDALKDATEDRE